MSLLFLFPSVCCSVKLPLSRPTVFCLFLSILLRIPAGGGAATWRFCCRPQPNQNMGSFHFYVLTSTLINRFGFFPIVLPYSWQTNCLGTLNLERILYIFLRRSWVRFSEYRRNFLFIIYFRLIILYLNASHPNMFQ